MIVCCYYSTEFQKVSIATLAATFKSQNFDFPNNKYSSIFGNPQKSFYILWVADNILCFFEGISYLLFHPLCNIVFNLLLKLLL